MTNRINVSLLTDKHFKDPFATYRKLRHDAPITKLNDGGMWAISRFSDVQFSLDNPQIFSSTAYQCMFNTQWISDDCKGGRFIASMDGEEHREARVIIHNALKFCFKNGITDTARHTAAETVKKIQPCTEIDFIRDFSLPFVSTIVSKLIGTYSLQPLHEIDEWIQLENEHTPIEPSSNYKDRFEFIIKRQNSYFDQVINDRRKKPQNDLVTYLVQSKLYGDPLPDYILRDALALIGASGYQTAMHGLANAILELSSNNQLLVDLQNDKKLIPKFWDELLRIRPPLHNALRKTMVDVTINNTVIPKDSLVLILIASANRDSNAFKNPDKFIINRAEQSLSFGYGVHKCAGEALARTELNVGLEAILKRFTSINCCCLESDLEWSKSLFMRCTNKLPVIFS